MGVVGFPSTLGNNVVATSPKMSYVSTMCALQGAPGGVVVDDAEAEDNVKVGKDIRMYGR